MKYQIKSFWLNSGDSFAIHFIPWIAFTALSRELASQSPMPGWRYSISIGWLYFSFVFAFGKQGF